MNISGKKLEKFFLCANCDESFISTKDLRFHLKTHENSDMSQILYTKSCRDIRLQSYEKEAECTFQAENAILKNQILELNLGYALPKPKKNVRFTEAQ